MFAYIEATLSDRNEAMEIVQGIFEKLWQRRAVLEIESLRSYLLSSARYGMVAYFRRSRKTRQFAEHYTLFEAVYESLPEAERDENTMEEKLSKAIERLAGRCRTALKLQINENLTYKEIAQRMNVTAGTVELFIVKARAELKAQLRIGNSR
jgi:RNA polymerase sigma factor (sigma-70 family)